MEEINLKAELQEERENLIWTLNAIRNNPVFIDEEYRALIYAVKQIDEILTVFEGVRNDSSKSNCLFHTHCSAWIFCCYVLYNQLRGKQV